jgi:hypothetical protein
MTRLGEFSPFGRLFSLDRLSKISELVQISCLLFSTVKVCINDNKKWVGLHLGAIFSQTHLVTVPGYENLDPARTQV